MEKIGFVFQNNGIFTNFDGDIIFECREYILPALL